MKFCDIQSCEKIFVVCFILHNIMVYDMETSDNKVGEKCETPEEGDGMWLSNIVDPPATPWS